MQVRRALLLLAIVLGLAALAASLSRPRDGLEDETSPERPETSGRVAPTATPSPARSRPAMLRLDASRPRRAVRLSVGRAAVLTVGVPEPGQVDVPGLGLAAAAEPLTPARFDVLVSAPGRYELRFTPAGTERSSPAGVLKLTGAR